jgi:hypothetical protein
MYIALGEVFQIFLRGSLMFARLSLPARGNSGHFFAVQRVGNGLLLQLAGNVVTQGAEGFKHTGIDFIIR